MKYSKKIVLAAIIAIIAFWISESILLAAFDVGYSDTFVICWFTFWSVELVSLAGIKITESVNNPYLNKDEIGG